MAYFAAAGDSTKSHPLRLNTPGLINANLALTDWWEIGSLHSIARLLKRQEQGENTERLSSLGSGFLKAKVCIHQPVHTWKAKKKKTCESLQWGICGYKFSSSNLCAKRWRSPIIITVSESEAEWTQQLTRHCSSACSCCFLGWKKNGDNNRCNKVKNVQCFSVAKIRRH